MNPVATQILQFLEDKPFQKASGIAKQLGLSKKEVNLILYRELRGRVMKDEDHNWFLVTDLRSQEIPSELDYCTSPPDWESSHNATVQKTDTEQPLSAEEGAVPQTKAPPEEATNPRLSRFNSPQPILAEIPPIPEWPLSEALQDSEDGLLDYALSIIRGVYNFDRELQRIQEPDDFKSFLETKLNFLPSVLREEARNRGKDADLTLLSQAQLSRHKLRKRTKLFFSWHPYFSIALGAENDYANSDKFLEIKFVEQVLTPLLTDNGLQAIFPQHPIGPYIVDFALQENSNKLVIEVDGFGKFQRREDLDKFLQRQNYLTHQGWVFQRFSYTDIMETPGKTVAILRAYLAKHGMKNLLNYGSPADGSESFSFNGDDPVINAYASIEYVNCFYQIQDYFVSLCVTGRHSTFDFQDNCDSEFPIVAIALSELFYYWDCVKPLVCFEFPSPVVKVQYERPVRVVDGLHQNIQVSQGVGEIPITSDVVRSTQRITGVCRKINAVPFKPVKGVEQLQHQVAPLLKYFFNYATTKQFQNQVLKSIFNNDDVLGISATGSGKSMCFWLPALARPGLTIVVSPLKSLMRDQKASLEAKGIASVAFLNSDLAADEKDFIMRQVVAGQIRLLYVAPERLRIKAFKSQLAMIQGIIPINCIAIDEAHCVSEWGHDFRPSYLKVRAIIDELRRENDTLNVVALTATAGDMVKPDILSTIGLTRDNLVQSGSSDRERFSYQVISVEGSEQKDIAVKKLLKQHVPKSLKIKSLESVLSHKNSNQEKAVALLFCIYADPHGTSTVRSGVSHYLRLVKQITADPIDTKDPKATYGSGRVRAFSSKSPTLCPFCYSYAYSRHRKSYTDSHDDMDSEDDESEQTSVQKSARQQCHSCQATFSLDDTYKPDNWDSVLYHNQKAFKASEIDMLVATKGFGMGIDKSSVRFIVHTSLSSGMESWYQEAGRAGRDNERAHIVLLADLPNDECRAALEANKSVSFQPSCNYLKGCPYGKAELCDYGKQHAFIIGSYKGVASDTKRALKLLAKATRNAEFADTYILRSTHMYVSQNEIALQRLCTIGLLKDFVVEYRKSPIFHIAPRITVSNTLEQAVEMLYNQLQLYLDRYSNSQRERASVQDLLSEVSSAVMDAALLDELVEGQLGLYGLHDFWETVHQHVAGLLHFTYSRVLSMRYQMLHTLDVMANSESCRRITILNYFSGDDNSVDDGYACGMCDRCSPKLNFLETRVPPTSNASIEEKEAELNELVKHNDFNLSRLSLLSADFHDYRTARYIQASRVLETAPDNLPALYLAFKFAPSTEAPASAVRLIDIANRRRIELADIREIYHQMPEGAKAGALIALNRENSSADSLDGYLFLELEAKNKLSDPKVRDLHTYMQLFNIVEHIDQSLLDAVGEKTSELEKLYNA